VTGLEASAGVCLGTPGAEIASLGPEGSAEIFFGDEIKAAADPVTRRRELVQEFRDKVASPYAVSAAGRFERIIDPKETRREIVQALLRNLDKKVAPPMRKHGIIPV